VTDPGSIIRIAWLGDIVGKAGRSAAAHAAQTLRASSAPPHIIVANAENARHGRGLHPEGLEELRAGNIDVITLGDHAMDDPRILPALKSPKVPLIAPINMDLPDGVKRRWVATLDTPAGPVPVVFLIVLGRIFMRAEFPDPFGALDAAMESIALDHPGALVLVEVHAEATSEKQALAWHARLKWGGDDADPLRATIVAVVGSHTHVQTSDARILDGRTAALTDLGMTGASRSVIGFLIEGSINRLKTPPSGGLDVAEENPVAHGAVIEIDATARTPLKIEAVRIPL
jgi:calcineurin-like phosphoesterase